MHTLSFVFSGERIYCAVPIESIAKHIQVLVLARNANLMSWDIWIRQGARR